MTVIITIDTQCIVNGRVPAMSRDDRPRTSTLGGLCDTDSASQRFLQFWFQFGDDFAPVTRPAAILPEGAPACDRRAAAAIGRKQNGRNVSFKKKTSHQLLPICHSAGDRYEKSPIHQ